MVMKTSTFSTVLVNCPTQPIQMYGALTSHSITSAIISVSKGLLEGVSLEMVDA